MDNFCIYADLHGSIKSTVPVVTVREVFSDIGVELAVRILSTVPLTCICITQQLIANVRTSEIYSLLSHLNPVC